VHPGPDLALLNAVLVYEALHGEPPAVVPLTVHAPIYGASSGLRPTLRASDAPPPLPDTPLQVHYPAETMKKLLDAVGGSQ